MHDEPGSAPSDNDAPAWHEAEAKHHLSHAERAALQAVLRRARLVRHPAEIAHAGTTSGQRIADGVAARIGSWPFIIFQSILLLCWLVANSLAWINHWDPYPFILLNLALSFQAAYSAPIIMMSQNREAAKDRIAAEEDYQVNLRAELEIVAIHAQLDDLAGAQWDRLLEIQARQEALLADLHDLSADATRPGANDRAGSPPPG